MFFLYERLKKKTENMPHSNCLYSPVLSVQLLKMFISRLLNQTAAKHWLLTSWAQLSLFAGFPVLFSSLPEEGERGEANFE